ncbi:MAG: AI-2E family transporter, partial [Bacteroidia bacterium]
MNNIKDYPFYFKTAFILLSFCLIVLILYVGQHIIFPLLLATLVSILLRPVVNFFNKKLRFPNALAITISVLLALVFVASIILFVSWQIGDIANDWNKIKSNVTTHFHNI